MGKYRSEWKYCIDNVSLQPIRERLLAVMDRDSHANENGKYEIHSLYFDDFQNTCARENMAGDGIRYKYSVLARCRAREIPKARRPSVPESPVRTKKQGRRRQHRREGNLPCIFWKAFVY